MKKLLGTLAVLTLAFGLTACGGAPETREQGSVPVDTPIPKLRMYPVQGIDGVTEVMCVASTMGTSASISCDWENAK